MKSCYKNIRAIESIYRAEARQNEVRSRSIDAPIVIQEKPKRTPVKKVMSQDHLAIYNRLGTDRIKKKLEHTIMLEEALYWLSNFKFKTFATLKPKKSQIDERNARRLFMRALNILPTINNLFYTVESGKGIGNHAHILIDGTCTKEEFATAIKRSSKRELTYWENINDQSATIVYSSKGLKKGELLKDFGLLNQQHVETELNEGLQLVKHPNEKFHTANKIRSIQTGRHFELVPENNKQLFRQNPVFKRWVTIN